MIGEYDGEARLIQEPDPGETEDHDVIFLCEAGEAAELAASRAPADSLVIDVVGSLSGAERPPLVHMDINPEEAKGKRGRLAVPHPAALLLAELLEPLERGPGLQDVVVLVIRPAADFGEEGVEERPLTDEQRAEIAEARNQYEARVAEREILHRDALLRARDPEQIKLSDITEALAEVAATPTDLAVVDDEAIDAAVSADLSRLTGTVELHVTNDAPVPLGALEEVVKFYLQTHEFTTEQVVETALLA